MLNLITHSTFITSSQAYKWALPFGLLTIQ